MNLFNPLKKKKTNMNDTAVPNDSSNDAKYHALSKKTQEHLKAGNLGLYRNDLFEMSEILRKEGRYDSQLQLLVTIFYIDMCGFSDLDTYQLAKQDCYKFLKPSPFIAPRIANNIRICAKRLSLSGEQLHNFFLQNLSESMVPVHIFTIEECYTALQLYLQDDEKKQSAKTFIDKKVKDFIRKK